MLWENTTNSIQEESMDIMECASLISNNFTLNSTSPSAPSHRQQQTRNRSSVLSYSSHNNTEKPTMGLDDLSFYDEKTTEPRLFSSQIDDDDDDVGGLLSSAENSPLRFHVSENMVLLEKYDSNSFDSGYSCSQNQKQNGNQNQFKFAEPKLPTTKKLSFLEPSPRKQPNFKIFHSLSSSSTESIDDDLDLDLIEMESIESMNVSTFPSNLNSLISGHIKSTKPVTPIKMSRPQVRRCLSLTNDNIVDRSALLEPKTPEFILKKSTLLNTPSSSKERCFKRPEPPSFSPVLSKRYKIDDNKENSQLFLASKSIEKTSISNSNSTKNESEVVNISRVLRKSMSLNDAQIMTALARSSSEPDLIGDFSKPFSLPLMDGKHQDLKSISVNTMAQLLNGEFTGSIGKFKIIDCRYPYEYEGGHIRGAQNLYTHEQILEELVNCKTEAPTIVQSQNDIKRNILIFHCEFSSERGPKLSRFLRNHDRLQNSNSYPALHYPEIYLLHGGYKEFYEFYSELCDPIAYRPMLEPSFGEQYRHFRAKSKSWNGDIKSTASKYGLKKSRSRLVL